eukprot:scpid83266/ scgid29182/ 
MCVVILRTTMRRTRRSWTALLLCSTLLQIGCMQGMQPEHHLNSPSMHAHGGTEPTCSPSLPLAKRRVCHEAKEKLDQDDLHERYWLSSGAVQGALAAASCITVLALIIITVTVLLRRRGSLCGCGCSCCRRYSNTSFSVLQRTLDGGDDFL